jgi:hypothetical protein
MIEEAEQRFVAGTEAAGDADDGPPGFASKLSNVLRRFAEGGLAVEAALAGDHDIGIADAFFQRGCLADYTGARKDFGAAEGDESGAEATGCSGAGDVPYVDAEVALNNVRKMGQRRIQICD